MLGTVSDIEGLIEIFNNSWSDEADASRYLNVVMNLYAISDGFKLVQNLNFRSIKKTTQSHMGAQELIYL